jgi:Integrase core domain
MFCFFFLSTSTSSPIDLVHSDVWGPSPIVSSKSYKYYIIFIDDYSHFTWVYFFKLKSEVCHIFSLFKAQVENLLNTTIKVLRTDKGTEYKPIASMFSQIVHQTTCPYTP